MAEKNGKEDNDNYVSLFDFFMNNLDYEAMDEERRHELIQTLMMILACAEDDQLNMNKVAALVERISSGKMNFPT